MLILEDVSSRSVDVDCCTGVPLGESTSPRVACFAVTVQYIDSYTFLAPSYAII